MKNCSKNFTTRRHACNQRAIQLPRTLHACGESYIFQEFRTESSEKPVKQQHTSRLQLPQLRNTMTSDLTTSQRYRPIFWRFGHLQNGDHQHSCWHYNWDPHRLVPLCHRISFHQKGTASMWCQKTRPELGNTQQQHPHWSQLQTTTVDLFEARSRCSGEICKISCLILQILDFWIQNLDLDLDQNENLDRKVPVRSL